MFRNIRIVIPLKTLQAFRRWRYPFALLAAVCLFLPITAYAQSGSPFDSGFTSLQNLFTGTVAKVASLIAIVIGGYGFSPFTSTPSPCLAQVLRVFFPGFNVLAQPGRTFNSCPAHTFFWRLIYPEEIQCSNQRKHPITDRIIQENQSGGTKRRKLEEED